MQLIIFGDLFVFTISIFGVVTWREVISLHGFFALRPANDVEQTFLRKYLITNVSHIQ